MSYNYIYIYKHNPTYTHLFSGPDTSMFFYRRVTWPLTRIAGPTGFAWSTCGPITQRPVGGFFFYWGGGALKKTWGCSKDVVTRTDASNFQTCFLRTCNNWCFQVSNTKVGFCHTTFHPKLKHQKVPLKHVKGSKTFANLFKRNHWSWNIWPNSNISPT